METADKKNESKQRKQPVWLIYTALVLAGVMLLAEAYQISHLSKWTARLGVALIYTAIALLIGAGRWASIMAVVIVWLGILITFIW